MNEFGKTPCKCGGIQRGVDHLLLSFCFLSFPDDFSCVLVQLTKDYNRTCQNVFGLILHLAVCKMSGGEENACKRLIVVCFASMFTSTASGLECSDAMLQ
jgi:hypothetical protein